LRRPIEVVTFDADPTLVDFEAAMDNGRDRKRNVASGAWAEIHSLVDLPDVLARFER
jgi:FMN phosphatase YigB (HAD superfamily)